MKKLNQELIEKLRNGEIAVENTGTVEGLNEVLKATGEVDEISGGYKFYYFKHRIGRCNDETNLPSRPISDFFTESEPTIEMTRSELFELIDKGMYQEQKQWIDERLPLPKQKVKKELTVYVNVYEGKVKAHFDKVLAKNAALLDDCIAVAVPTIVTYEIEE